MRQARVLAILKRPAVAAFVLAVAPLAASAPSPAATSAPVLAIDFAELTVGESVYQVRMWGTSASALDARALARDGGGVVGGTSSVSADARSMRFPTYRLLRSSGTPVGVLRVRNTTAQDALAVGTRDFTWSADFRLDQQLGDVAEDGDNLFQRGLWGDAAQWKLSVDGRRAQCQLGFGSRRLATPTVWIPNDGWHRATCSRRASGTQAARLSLLVERWDGTRFAWVARTSSSGNAWGALDFDRWTPVSIGGKLTDGWTIHPQPDQFNGKIDRVRLWVD